MLRVLDSRTDDVKAVLAQRESKAGSILRSGVEETIREVREKGDQALVQSANQFDSSLITDVRVSVAEIENATVEAEVLTAIRVAKQRIEAFHEMQLDRLTQGWERDLAGFRWTYTDETNAQIGQRMLPLRTAGIYVPGGRAAYPSSVLMNAIPAQVAGVQNIVLCTPARPDGTLSPAVLVACREIGVKQVFKIGGAAAIAAMAYGTASVPRVDAIAGPGNAWVNEAKRQVWGHVGLDGYAGPSEVCVLVDADANAAWAAADLITQIEHAPDNIGTVITTDARQLSEIQAELTRQIADAPRRTIIAAALRDFGLAILTENLDQACVFINDLAPEHLTLAVQDPEAILPHIRNAGCILLGEWTPESAGDYCIGPSHTLPTSGAARFGSPVNVLNFLKCQSVSRLDQPSLASLRKTIESFGAAEGFPAHSRGASIRFE